MISRRIFWPLWIAAILCCLAPAGAFWQTRDSNYNQNVASGGGGPTCVNGSTQGNAFLARVTSAGATLDTTHQTAYCTLIACQVTAGTYSLKDVQYIFATNVTAGSATTVALLNTAQNAFNASVTGTPTFTADTGYKAAGAGDFIATGFNPSTASSPQFTQNSAHILLWNLTNTTNLNSVGGNTAAGTAGESNIFAQLTSDSHLYTRINDNSGNGGQVIGNPQGWIGATRTSSTNIQYYQNGSALGGAVTNTSAAPSNAAFQVLAVSGGNADQSHQIAGWSTGAALNSTQAAADYACVHAYMQTIAGVP